MLQTRAAACSLLLLLTACGTVAEPERSGAASTPQASPMPSGSASTFSLTPYPLDDAPEAAIASPGNTHIFEARIEGTAAPRRSDTPPGSPVPFLVYLPVTVSITAVYKGALTVGDRVVLRDLGGTAPDGTTFVYSDSFQDATWIPGRTLFVFSNAPTTDDHAGTALTPNMVYVEDDGSVRSAHDNPQQMRLTEMRMRVAQRWG